MQDLSIVSVEHGALVLEGADGGRYRVVVDDAVRTELRRASTAPASGRKATPREIQAHIRSGMSADDVAAITGTPLDYIQRFERPVLAEREFIVGSALAVAVHTPADTSPVEGGATFGAAIRARLAEMEAVGERWSSWKDEADGWIVKLAFTVGRVEHDARWSFDARRHTLAPANDDALSLSAQEQAPRTVVPRLRAVESAESESTRFDSAAFRVEEPVDDAPLPREIVRPSTGHTADLLEALRRRRGEREAAAFADLDDAKAKHPSTGSIRLVEVPLEGLPAEEPARPAPTPLVPRSSSRKGRVSMPSWDEIVFGAKPDDDLA
jgi:hypothetical protein